ncbi:nucleotidyltransferase family protein [Sphingobacterium sp. LRF_L2]|uniref:nucleotidyltransferase family protein n=1 Tax=Sphingobacterium sp. LRF_L2 TaxID=3369421 RepID=UPI003F6031B8
MMQNKKTYDAFFVLLRAGLWNRPIDALRYFPLETTAWEQLFTLAIQQTVEGLVFDGMQKLPKEYFPPRSLLLRWTVRIDAIERRSLWMNGILDEQACFFEENNIHAVLLKGQGLAQCYANPLRRVTGDVDWYFPNLTENRMLYKKLEQQGIKATKSAGFSYSFLWKNCETESHERLFDLHNPFIQKLLRRLEREEKLNKQFLALDKSKIILLSPQLTFIQVNAHILKHLLAFGIGIRQLCDSARVCYTYSRVVDGENLRKRYKQLGILKWIDVLHALLVDYLGLEEQDLPFERDQNIRADWMMEEILVAGNFGFHDPRVDLVRELQTNRRVDSFKRWKSNFRRYLPYAPYEAMFFPIMQFYSRLFT